MQYIDQLDKSLLKNKKVFIRADLNVPIDETGKVADDTRLTASIPTIKYVIEAGGAVVLASHLGRPKGKVNDKYSLKPIAHRLTELMGVDVIMASDCIGQDVLQKAQSLKSGQILLLENLRFHNEEEDNDEQFAKQLSSLADVYVNDAFATAHRAHASTAGITKFVNVKVGGFTLKDELEYFAKAFTNPKRPLVAIFGGAKVSTKMEALRNVGQNANRIIIGGAMANTFFAAQGHGVGRSLYEPAEVQNAKEIKEHLEKIGCEIVLPIDVVVASELKSGLPTHTVSIDSIPETEMALDIGPKSIELFRSRLADSQTIVWNGPMGAFEIVEFSSGTYAIVDILMSSKALTVVGGGDTDRALHDRHAMDKMGYVSTAGGAFLELLEGKTLPAVAALN